MPTVSPPQVEDVLYHYDRVLGWLLKEYETGVIDEETFKQHFSQLVGIQERLNISIFFDNCEPLSGNLEITKLQPDAMDLFKQLSAWTEITFHKQNRAFKNSLH